MYLEIGVLIRNLTGQEFHLCLWEISRIIQSYFQSKMLAIIVSIAKKCFYL